MKIETDADHKAALARIDALMDAEAGTPEAAELSALAEAVEEFESVRFPIAPPTDAEAAEFRREQSNIIRLGDHKAPTHYSVHLSSHWDGALTVEVTDVQIDDRSMRAVADDLERAAKMIREKHTSR